MNIEQIALEVADELFLGGKAVGNEPAEFLRRCLSKLAEQAGKPLGTANALIDDYVLSKTNINPNDRLYTEAQCLAAQQRTAEACAELCGTRAQGHPFNHAVRRDEAQACEAQILSGEWREYL